MKYDITITLHFEAIEADGENEALGIIAEMNWNNTNYRDIAMECSVCHHDTAHGCICEDMVCAEECDQQATVKHNGRLLCDDHHYMVAKLEQGEWLKGRNK